MSERSEFHCFGARRQENQRWPKVFVLIWRILSNRAPAEERSCLEGDIKHQLITTMGAGIAQWLERRTRD